MRLRIALTIAGSDSGGGAGIQADLKTFTALGVHGASAITCITAQNPRRVTAIEPCSAKVVREQIAAVFEELPPAAIKTGMLFSAAIVRAVVASLKSNHAPAVVDPVLISTSGRPLLERSALDALRKQLLPIATLVTPNLAETEALLGCKVRSPEEMRQAARQIYEKFGCAAVVKGGHLVSSKEAADVFYDGSNELLLTAPFVPRVRTHGTGCVFSAAITAHLALGRPLAQAVIGAKEFVTRAIAESCRIGKHFVLA